MNAEENCPVPNWLLNIGPISCHAWNKDRTQLAVSPSNNEIHIYTRSGSEWILLHVLREHDMLITGLDWSVAPNTNRIVSCSHDKNAFVWTWNPDTKEWKPVVVNVRTSKAATCVKWSPNENKFAVGTGARLVAICYYDRGNDWWAAKQIKKPIFSTVSALDWHPNNILLAVGSCDFKTRVFSAYVKEIDEKPAPNPWGTKMPLGELLKEYQATGWVHDLAFSPSGCKLAWVSHDSSIAVIDKSSSPPQEQPILHKTPFLPFTSIRWVNETHIVAAGHDCSPMLFTFNDQSLELKCKLDVPPESKSGSNVNSAFAMFRSIDKKALSIDSPLGCTALKTLHQNSIMQIRPHTFSNQQGTALAKFTTCALDGVVALWDVQAVFEYCQKRLGKSLQNGAAYN